MHPVLMLFIDGVGIGKNDPLHNPFFKYEFRTFTELFGSVPSLNNKYLEGKNKFLFPVDARLGVDGLPQSGTGQTSIFCGVNAAKMIGKHFGPYPYSTLIPVIKEKNILLHYKMERRKVFFANAYPKIFFDYIRSGKSRLSVISLSCVLSGIRLNRVTDVRKGKALTAEITGSRWNEKLGYNLKVIKPQTAARRLLRIANKNHFTLYEYFLTDHLGHGRYDSSAEAAMRILDEFLYTIFSEMDLQKTTVILCSDHGNFEDLSVKTHTINPALTITAGKKSKQLADRIKSISQIKKAIIELCK